MAHYKYKAIDQSGKTRTGTTEQSSIDQVVDWLAADGLLAVEIEPVKAGATGTARGASGSGSKGFRLWKRKRSKNERILHFTRDLAVMLGSGLPLDKSLGLQEKMIDPDGQAMVQALRNDLRQGVGLAEAFAARDVFSPFYISMVRAGEASGSLESSLARMADYMERAKALRQMIASALTYPTILLVVAILSLIFLLSYVVPGFADLFTDMGGELPGPTRVVMQMGEFMGRWWWLVIAGLALAVWGARRLFEREGFRQALDARVLRWPLIGELIRNIETSRFSRTLGVLLQGGVTMVSALAIARETVSNRVLREELLRAANALKEGKSLSGTLLEGEQFPILAMNMVAVGEETGRLEQMLLKVADIYEEEVGTVTKRVLALLEPLLILTLGVMIAGIIVSILLGILGVNELIG